MADKFATTTRARPADSKGLQPSHLFLGGQASTSALTTLFERIPVLARLAALQIPRSRGIPTPILIEPAGWCRPGRSPRSDARNGRRRCEVAEPRVSREQTGWCRVLGGNLSQVGRRRGEDELL